MVIKEEELAGLGALLSLLRGSGVTRFRSGTLEVELDLDHHQDSPNDSGRAGSDGEAGGEAPEPEKRPDATGEAELAEDDLFWSSK